jgi:hypothetical protein
MNRPNVLLSLKCSGLQGRYYTFADDTVLVVCGDGEGGLEGNVNEDLRRYTSWLDHSLNIKVCSLPLHKLHYILHEMFSPPITVKFICNGVESVASVASNEQTFN